MLEPRPEIRMATRLRVVIRAGSRLGSNRNAKEVTPVPSLKLQPTAINDAVVAARADAADRRHRFARLLQHRRDLRGLAGSHNGDHADAAVEGAQHFLVRDVSGF